MGHPLDQEGAPGVRGVGSGRMLKGHETPSAAPASGLTGQVQIQGKGRGVGGGDLLGGSFRDPHFQLVAVHDVTLREQTTQPVLLS